MRCNFVDLYYALYGSKVPHCLARPVSTMSMGLPKIPKLSDAKRPNSPSDKPTNAVVEKLGSMEPHETFKRQFESINDHAEIKDEPFEARVDVKVIDTLHSLSIYYLS